MPKVSSSRHKAFKAASMLASEQYQNQVPFPGKKNSQSVKDFSKAGRKEPDSGTSSRKKYEEAERSLLLPQQRSTLKTSVHSTEKEEHKTFRDILWTTDFRTLLYGFHTSLYGILTLACLVQALRTCNMELLVNLWKVAVSFAAAKGLIQGFKEFSIKRK